MARFAYFVYHCWQSGLLQRQSCPQLTASKLIGYNYFYYRIAAQVQRNRVSKLWKLLTRGMRCCAKHCRHAQFNLH